MERSLHRDEKHVSLDVFNYDRVKLCNLYDSALMADGQAYDITYSNEIGGFKTLEFSLPYIINQRHNFRWDYIKAEYLVRMVIDDEIDWFILDAPTKRRDDKSITKKVTCSHLSTILKTKNLYMTFDDENGIGTLPYLVEQVLRGTQWTFDDTHSDTFYESDGETEKIRSLISDGKDGAYQLITDICNLFDAYPVYDGENKTVTCYSLNNKGALREMTIGKDLNSIEMTHDSKALITRMYVEGEYGDGEYLGIDTVNPTGLPFLMDFSYYQELGLFTAEHQAALEQYYVDMGAAISTVRSLATRIIEDENTLNLLWGQIDYVYYPVVNGVLDTEHYILGGDATIDDAIVPAWDATKEYHYGDIVSYNDKVYKAKLTSSPGTLPTNTTYWEEVIINYTIMQSNGQYRDVHELDLTTSDTAVIKFLLLPSGTIGGKQLGVETKEQQIDSTEVELAKEQSRPSPSAEKIAQYEAQIDAYENGIVELYTGVGVVSPGVMRSGGFNNSGVEQDQANAIRSDVITVAHFIPYTLYGDSGYKATMFCFNSSATMIGTFTAQNNATTTIDADNVIFSNTEYFRLMIESLDGTTVPTPSKAVICTTQDNGLYALMNQAVSTLLDLNDALSDRETALNSEDDIEATFAIAMGDMLKEGYWNNTNYAEGQEQALYDDALEMMQYMCHPDVSMSVDRVSLANQLGYKPYDLQLNMKVRLFDEKLGINDLFYISKFTYYLDDSMRDEVELSNKDLNIQGLTLDSVLSRMAELADLIDQKNALYERAEAINGDGSIYMERLEGVINIMATKIISSKSSWYTDDNGNIMFESSNGKSAMMLTGDGWMIANGKKSDGTWNWRTAADGTGITADVIVTGFLSADRIEARSISAAKLTEDVGAHIDLSENGTITAITDSIDQTNASVSVNQTSIELLNTEIASKVSTTTYNTDMTGKADIDWVSQTVASVQAQTATDITNIFYQATQYTDNSVSEYAQLKSDVYSWQSFSANGLELGKSDSPFKAKLSNSKLAFTQNEEEVSYFSDNAMYITNARVTNTLSVGTQTDGWFDWVMTSSGLAMKWKT